MELAFDTHLSQSILRLGIHGFDEQERLALARQLNAHEGPQWRLGDFRHADAWWIKGSKVRALADASLKVLAGVPTERALKLTLGELDRPIAFALPLPLEDFEPAHTFNPACIHGMSEILLAFDKLLRMVRVQFILGEKIIRGAGKLRRSVYHVSYCGDLVAVLDLRRGKVGVSPHLQPKDLLAARWDRRPRDAGITPPDFVPLTVRELSWTCASRSTLSGFEMLPSAFRTALIYFRQVPRVPPTWISDSQLMVLRALLSGPATIQDLHKRTRLTTEELMHDVTSLYYGGAISTSSAKASRPVKDRHGADHASSGLGMLSPWPDAINLEARPINGLRYFTRQQPLAIQQTSHDDASTKYWAVAGPVDAAMSSFQRLPQSSWRG